MPAISVSAALNEGTYVLSAAGVDGARANARALLEHVLGVENLVLVPREGEGARLSEKQSAKFFTLIGARAQRRPLQHLTGRMYFRNLTLKSRPGVFIVRPETEVVAGAAIEILQNMIAEGGAHRAIARRGSTVRPETEVVAGAAIDLLQNMQSNSTTPVVVDLCTGSGAIALAIKQEVPAAQVWAVELNPLSLQLAAHNMKTLGLPLELIKGDATDPDSWASAPLRGGVDLVVSNPPYVAEKPTQPEALQDPALALYGGGEGGLETPQKIITAAARLLRAGGALVMEHGEDQAAPLRSWAARQGFTQVSTGNDLAGAPRYLQATCQGFQQPSQPISEGKNS